VGSQPSGSLLVFVGLLELITNIVIIAMQI